MLAPALLVALAAAGPVVAPAVATAVEVDTNAARVASGVIGDDDEDPGKLAPPTAPPERPALDGLTRTDVTVDATLGGDSFVLRSESAFGLKLFFEQEGERMVVGQSRATLQALRLPGELSLSLSAFAKARAQRSGRRTYALARGDMMVERPLFGVRWRAGLEGQAFEAFDDQRFSSGGGGLVLGAAVPLGDAERLDLIVDLAGRGFPFAPKDYEDPAQRERRTDGSAALVAQLTSARRLYLSGSWVAIRNLSNARGESFLRHRLQALVGTRLPGRVTAVVQGTLQLTQYDDGVSVGQSYFLGNDEETQNQLEITLSRPLLGDVSVEARCAFQGNELAVEGARYARQIAGIGLRARL